MRTMLLRLSTAVLCSVGAAGPARSEGASPVTSPAGRIAMEKFAKCVVSRDPKASEQVIRSSPGAEDEEVAFSQLAKAISACDKRTPTAGFYPGRTIFRGAIAEQLWLRQTTAVDVSNATRPSPNDLNFDNGFESAPLLKIQYRTSFCVALTKVELIDALLRTAPGSAAETAAIAPVADALARCAPNGETVRMDRTMARALLAEQLVRVYPRLDRPTSRADLLLNEKK